MAEKVNGLLGRSLKHSFSEDIHRELGNPSYRLYELEPEQLEAFLTGNEIELLNVTIPYKKTIAPYCAVLSDEAQAIGSVNTIISTPDGLYGHNTDIFGFNYMVARAGIALADKKVLIFGGGGASASAGYAAQKSGARSVVVISRRGEDNYGTLPNHADAEVLVNATPLGMYPSEIGNSVVDLALFPQCEAVLDLVYNPLRTALMMQATARGIVCTGGLAMLVAQAKAAAELRLSRQEADGVLGHPGDRALGQSADGATAPLGSGTVSPSPGIPVSLFSEPSPSCPLRPSPEIERILRLIQAKQENIILIGMPGSGKTTIGKELAQIAGRVLVDLDDKVVDAAGMTIPEIFSKLGEEAFRDLESEQAALYGREHGLIITAGGGIIKQDRNYAPLRQNGRLYHVVRGTALLTREGRPLSLQADLEQLSKERLPQYINFRDVAIDNSGTPKETAECIWKEFNEYTRH